MNSLLNHAAYLQDLQLVQPVLAQWRIFEPSLSEGLQAMGEATNTCAESQRNLIDSQKQSLTVVFNFEFSHLQNFICKHLS